MSIETEILEILLKPKFRYKGISVNMLGLPAIYKKSSIRSAIYRLKKEECIGEDKGHIVALSRSKDYIKRKQESLTNFISNFSKGLPKDLLLMFDIPEAKKAEREWLRFHLKKFDYKMIQRSVWVGPSPLPKEFTDYLDKIELKECIKTFKLANNYK